MNKGYLDGIHTYTQDTEDYLFLIAECRYKFDEYLNHKFIYGAMFFRVAFEEARDAQLTWISY